MTPQRTIVITVPSKTNVLRKPTAIQFRPISNTTKPPTVVRRLAPSPTLLSNSPSPPPQRFFGKRGSSTTENNEPSYYSMMIPVPRKRERLTHLSCEEKLSRRKLKNRVAAQTARDRKKERTQNLEETIVQLTKENRAIVEENNSLLEQNRRLKEANKQLKRKLQTNETEPMEGSTVDVFGSAASINAPLPRDQTSSLFTLLMTFLQSICNESSTICCKEPNLSNKIQENLRKIINNSTSPISLTESQLQSLMELWKALKRKTDPATAEILFQ